MLLHAKAMARLNLPGTTKQPLNRQLTRHHVDSKHGCPRGLGGGVRPHNLVGRHPKLGVRPAQHVGRRFAVRATEAWIQAEADAGWQTSPHAY